MKKPIRLDRRRFVQMVGGTLLPGAIGSRFGWASVGAPTRRAKFAYIGAEHAIHVYSIAADGIFTKRQTIASAHPVAMAIRNGNLYVTNRLFEYGNLPRGSAEAFAIDRSAGLLEFKNRVPLSLSGILPQDLALAPDGRTLVVAVHGGGAFNVLSVGEDGLLGRVSGILKETGSGPHAQQTRAHPSALVFDRMGRVLTADQGSDRLSVLSIHEGRLAVVRRNEVTAGSGPSSLVLAPNGKRLFVAHSLNGSVSSFGYDSILGKILKCEQTVWTVRARGTAALAMHPSGESLYSSHGNELQSWKIAENGSLTSLPGPDNVQATKLHVTADGESLLALTSDAVLRMKIDLSTRVLSTPVRVASVSQPTSIAIL